MSLSQKFIDEASKLLEEENSGVAGIHRLARDIFSKTGGTWGTIEDLVTNRNMHEVTIAWNLMRIKLEKNQDRRISQLWENNAEEINGILRSYEKESRGWIL